MPLILPGNVGSATAATGFNVSNSLRFNSASNDHLNRTQTGGNRRKFTFSTWVKRCNPATRMALFLANRSGSNYDQLYLNESGYLEADFYHSGTQIFRYKTDALYRDPSSWYHMIMAVDTEHDTASSRVRIYVNGLEVTSFSTETNPSEDVDTHVNENSIVAYIGSDYNSNEPDYYLAETVMLDGTQAAPTDFGEFDGDSGIWKPIDVSGLTFGTNGFYLQYKETGTSADASGIGADTSGETNHFTVNNLTAVDQATDTCTNNFATLNSIDKGYGTTAFTEGNLNATSSSGWNPARGTIAVSAGKWYWEIVSGNSFQIGVCNDTIDFANNDNAQDLTGVTVFYNGSGGIIRTDGSTVGGTTATVDANDTVGFALDMDNKKLSVYKNGSIIVTNTSLSTSITDVAMIFGTTDGGGDFKINFGSPMYAISSGNTDGNGYGNFEYSVPSGYFSLNTKNLAEYG
jgi:hypothetical protein